MEVMMHPMKNAVTEFVLCAMVKDKEPYLKPKYRQYKIF